LGVKLTKYMKFAAIGCILINVSYIYRCAGRGEGMGGFGAGEREGFREFDVGEGEGIGEFGARTEVDMGNLAPGKGVGYWARG
jgi:hypothetical protein